MISITEINKILHETVHEGKTSVNNKKFTEPKYTEVLSVEFPNALNNNKSLPHNIRFGGCFIHQSPKAEFVSTHNNKSCELGDLLVFVRKATIDGERFNAALVQLKKSTSKEITLKDNGDLKQLILYEQWPCFSIPQIGRQYNIFPKTVTNGGVYGIILEKSGDFSQIYFSEPRSSMQCDRYKTFGRFIANMIDWNVGRSVADEKNKDSDEWSKLIWDTIRLVEHKTFNPSSKLAGHSKSSINFLQMMLKDSLSDGEITPSENKSNEKKSESGFGILYVDVDEWEHPRNQ